MKDFALNLQDSAIENLDVAEFEVLGNEDLSETDEKAIIGASCTTCVCYCSSCCSV